MSGTSMDGIDISLIKTNGTNYVKFISEKSYDYSPTLQNKIKKIVKNKPVNKNKMKKYFKQNENFINEVYIFFITKFLNEIKINKNETETLFLRGELSNYILDEDFEDIFKAFPNGEIKTIEGAGHWLHAENPISFYKKVVDFIN